MADPLVIIVIGAIVILAYHFLTKNNKKLKKFRKEWKTGDFLSLKEDFKSVSSYWSNKKNNKSSYDGIDQLTWDDLAMDEIFRKLNYTQSSVGSEYLFNQLRDIQPSMEHAEANEELYTLLAGNPELREEILLKLSGLGKRNYTNSSSFFFDSHSIKIKNAFVYVLLALLPVASIFLLFYSLKHGLACLFGSFLINTVVYYRNKSKLENDLFSASYAAGVIRAGKGLASVRHPKFIPHAKEFKEKVQPLKKILFVDRIRFIWKWRRRGF